MLTVREQEALRLTAQGLTNREMADTRVPLVGLAWLVRGEGGP
jgi:hypothetical protein